MKLQILPVEKSFTDSKEAAKSGAKAKKKKADYCFVIMAYLLTGLLFFLMAAQTMQRDGKCII